MKARLLFSHVLSPLHAGIGQGVGVIDLPIAREKATGVPYLPASSLKGVLRDACTDEDESKQIFGASDHAGSAQFSDLRLLLLPVRSLSGTFAWVTSPYLLHRLVRDLQSIQETTGNIEPLPSVPSAEMTETGCLVSDNGCQVTVENKVVLEDVDLSAAPHDSVRQWAEWIGARVFPENKAWQEMLAARLTVVNDNVMDFLLETATELSARIRLQEDTKTVGEGPWYEEALPTETILVGLVLATPVKASVDEVFATISLLTKKPLQFGGKATVGRGLCRLQMLEI